MAEYESMEEMPLLVEETLEINEVNKTKKLSETHMRTLVILFTYLDESNMISPELKKELIDALPITSTVEEQTAYSMGFIEKINYATNKGRYNLYRKGQLKAKNAKPMPTATGRGRKGKKESQIPAPHEEPVQESVIVPEHEQEVPVKKGGRGRKKTVVIVEPPRDPTPPRRDPTPPRRDPTPPRRNLTPLKNERDSTTMESTKPRKNKNKSA